MPVDPDAKKLIGDVWAEDGDRTDPDLSLIHI